LSLEQWHSKIARLETVLRAMGHITAWSHLRSSGRQGSAIADELIDFAAAKGWTAEVLRYAQRYARQVTEDWKTFRKAATSGAVPLPAASGG
jgi:uncharacterized protein (DUF2252 family)